MMLKDIFNILYFIFALWIIGFFSAIRVKDGNFKIKLPKFLSRILFIKYIKKNIILESVIYQMYVYVSTAILFLCFILDKSYKLYFYYYYTSNLYVVIIYCIIGITDTAIYYFRCK